MSRRGLLGFGRSPRGAIPRSNAIWRSICNTSSTGISGWTCGFCTRRYPWCCRAAVPRMSPAGYIPTRISASEAVQWTAVSALRPLHALMVAPSLLFLATLAIMLFRPPDLQLYWLDRVAFLVLVFVVLLRALALRQSLRVTGPVTWPMLGLLLPALSSLLAQPYQPQNWSMFAAKWVVPFALYH